MIHFGSSYYGGNGASFLSSAIAVPFARVVMGAGFPMTTCAGAVPGQRCGVHQASFAAVRPNVQAAVTLGLAASRRVAFYLAPCGRLGERNERGLLTRHQCSYPRSFRPLGSTTRAAKRTRWRRQAA